jgi:P27 family predicted phage terminase small subunit
MANPLPTRLHEQRGFANNRRKYEREIAAPNGDPQCPDYLDDIAQAEWIRITEALRQMDILSAVDAATIESACVNYSFMRQAQKVVSEQGTTIETDRGGEKANPSFRVFREANAQYNSLLKELCLSPTSRARVRQPIPKEKKNKLSTFLEKVG